MAADGFDPTLVAWTGDENLPLLHRAIDRAVEIAWDLETTGLDEHAPDARIVMLSLTIAETPTDTTPITWVVPLYHRQGPWFAEWTTILRGIVERMRAADATLIAHNGVFDCRWVRAHAGLSLADRQGWDTQVIEHLINENESTRLKTVVPRRFGIPAWDDFDLSSPGAATRVPLIQLGLYAARDTYWDLMLYRAQHRELVWAEDDPAPATEDEDMLSRLGDLVRLCVMPMYRNLTRVQERGMLLDGAWVASHLEKMHRIEQEAREELAGRYRPSEDQEAAGAPSFAPTSKWFRAWAAQAVSEGDLRVDAMTPGGVPQWSKTVLRRQEREGSEVASRLLELRQAAKQQEFLRSWQEKASPEGRIHARYNVGRVSTGRLSSSEPNLQQVTKDLKSAYVPTPGYLIVEADYSQIELRAAAFIARCRPMIEAYQRGDDLHRLMAAQITGKPISEITKGERQQAKAANFGLLYGQSPMGFLNYAEASYGVVLTPEEAQQTYDAFFRLWEGMAAWHSRTGQFVRRYGYVTSPLGRVRRLPDALTGDPYLVGQAERQAMNSPVQSFASDLMQMVAADIGGQFGNPVPDVRIVGTVHDSLVLEVPEGDWKRATARVMRRMNSPHHLLRPLGCEFDVPLATEAQVSTRWGAADIAVIT